MAQTAVAEGDLKRALSAYRELFEASPDSSELLLKVVDLSWMVVGREAARDLYLKYLSRTRNRTDGRIQQALERFRNRFEKDASQSLYLRAQMRIDQQNDSEAASLLNQASEMEPRHPLILESKGRVFRRLLQFESAKAAWEAAFESYPFSSELLDEVFDARLYAREAQAIVDQYGKSHCFVPSRRQAMTRAMALVDLGRCVEGMDAWKTLRRLGNAEDHSLVNNGYQYAAASCALKAGKPDMAYSLFRRFIETTQKELPAWDPFRMGERRIEALALLEKLK